MLFTAAAVVVAVAAVDDDNLVLFVYLCKDLCIYKNTQSDFMNKTAIYMYTYIHVF